MNTMKILLVEDTKGQQDVFESSVEVFNDKNQLNVEYELAEDISSALKKIDGSYDGVIIDLRLGDDEEGGNKIVRQLRDPLTRIPIIFVTAFIDAVIDHPSVIRKRSRLDEETYDSDLLLFQGIYNTGLTHIMGGRGIIEKNLTEVFLKNLLPQIETWMSYGKENSERTERALLRYTLNHLFQLLEEGGKDYFPEEVYLHPPLSENITTGSIVKEKTNDQPFAVLSPACDLVIKNGEFRTDRILLVEIEVENDIVNDALDDIKKKRSRENKLKTLFNNNHTDYYHWLPKTDFFEGGFLNFRKLKTVKAVNKADFDEQFETPSIQISPFFVKDIVSRFSSFYARQGQPDIDSKDFVDCYTGQQEKEQ